MESLNYLQSPNSASTLVEEPLPSTAAPAPGANLTQTTVNVAHSSPPSTDGEVSQTHLVILLHGIRTRGEWQSNLQFYLKDEIDNCLVKPLGYGYRNIFQFLNPWARSQPIKQIHSEIRYILKRHQQSTTTTTVIAHSFGTYVIAKIIEENPEIHINKLILCGSVLWRDFNWGELKNCPATLINEVGRRDIWPVLAKQVTFGFGNVGTFGFQSGAVDDRWHDATHSSYFSKAFYERYWLPLIQKNERNRTPYEMNCNRPQTPVLINLLSALPIKLFILAFLVAATIGLLVIGLGK